MRIWTLVVFLVLSAVPVSATASAETPDQQRQPVFDNSGYRPQIVFIEAPAATDQGTVTLRGVVFSRAPIDRVTIGKRVATLRPAQPKDLTRIEKAPEGATDAPFRTFFELPDIELPEHGANDLEVTARSADGRISPLYRVTIVRTTPVANDNPS